MSEDTGVARSEAATDHVLGLTVHNLPEPTQALAQESERTRRGRWKMLAVLLICAAPVIASYFTYYVVRPEGRRNNGELIDPQRPLPDLLALDLSNRTHSLRELKGQWLLVSVGSGRCAQACEQRLYFQRQLREALGKDKDRLDRVWLVTDTEPIPDQMQAGLEGVMVLRAPAADVAQWLEPASGQAIEDHLYVVDPLGNWMMRFPANLDIAGASKAKRDLDRLMRASASWDQAGR